MQMGGEGPQSVEVPVGWANLQIETARRTFLERHPLARSKLEAAIAKAEGMAWLQLWAQDLCRGSAFKVLLTCSRRLCRL